MTTDFQESVQKEIGNTLKWIKIRHSGSFRKSWEHHFDERDYHETVEEIRESARNEYKRNMPL